MSSAKFPSVEEIVEALNWSNYNKKDWVKLGRNLRWYKWVNPEEEAQNVLELKEGIGKKQIIVQREFGQLTAMDQILWDKWDPEIREYLEKFTLPTLEDAVRACVSRLIELRSGGKEHYTDTRIW